MNSGYMNVRIHSDTAIFNIYTVTHPSAFLKLFGFRNIFPWQRVLQGNFTACNRV